MTVNTEQAAATRLSPFFRVMDDPAGGRYCSNGIRAEGGLVKLLENKSFSKSGVLASNIIEMNEV